MPCADVHDALHGLAQGYFEFVSAGGLAGEGGDGPRDLGPRFVSTVQRYLATPAAEEFGLALLRSPPIDRLLERRGLGNVVGAVSQNVTIPFLSRLVQRQGGFRLTEDSFAAVYENLEVFLRKGFDEYILRASLRNFEMSAEPLSVAGFTLREMTRNEIEAYHGLTTTDVAALRVLLQQPICKYILERRVAVEGSNAPIDQATIDRFWWFLASLKLAKAGSVRYDEITVQPTSWETMSFSYSSLTWGRARPDRTYHLEPHDRDRIIALVNLLEEFADRTPLPFWKLALERLVEGIDRMRDDEALLDFWIACESLLGARSDQGELSYRLTLRLAHLLGETLDEREELQRDAKEAYRMRSKIVHGDIELSPSELTKHSRKMEDMTRRAVLRCVEQGWSSKRTMLQRIDRSILGGAERL